MIKLIGMAKKKNGMSHEECVKYHREKHASWEKRLMGSRGLEKYSAYYVDKAYSPKSGLLPERPWDLIVTQLYTDEGWKSLQTWKKTDPDGIKLVEDLGNFSDQKNVLMFICQENVIVRPERGDTGVNVVDCAAKRIGMGHEECVKHHREVHVPMVTRMLGSRLKKYVAYYVDETFSLAEGVTATRPYDVVAITQIAEEFWKGLETRQKSIEDIEPIELAKDEEHFIDRKSGILMVCQEAVFIP